MKNVKIETNHPKHQARVAHADGKHITFNPAIRCAFQAALKKADLMKDTPAMVLGVELKKSLVAS